MGMHVFHINRIVSMTGPKPRLTWGKRATLDKESNSMPRKLMTVEGCTVFSAQCAHTYLRNYLDLFDTDWNLTVLLSENHLNNEF